MKLIIHPSCTYYNCSAFIQSQITSSSFQMVQERYWCVFYLSIGHSGIVIARSRRRCANSDGNLQGKHVSVVEHSTTGVHSPHHHTQTTPGMGEPLSHRGLSYSTDITQAFIIGDEKENELCLQPNIHAPFLVLNLFLGLFVVSCYFHCVSCVHL